MLVLGVAYKADIDDLRESPALKVIRLLRDHGADVDYHDPYCAELPEFDLESIDLDGVPAHRRLRRGGHRHGALGAGLSRTSSTQADLVVDFRNATAGIPSAGNVWKL